MPVPVILRWSIAGGCALVGAISLGRRFWGEASSPLGRFQIHVRYARADIQNLAGVDMGPSPVNMVVIVACFDNDQRVLPSINCDDRRLF